jgi:hypothetical protein
MILIWDHRNTPTSAAMQALLDDDSYDLVAAAIEKLADEGPTLGRPLVDRVQSSRHHNMKELRRPVRRMAPGRVRGTERGGRAVASTWEQMRAERPPREDRVAEHRARLDAEVRAFRLREIREEQA